MHISMCVCVKHSSVLKNPFLWCKKYREYQEMNMNVPGLGLGSRQAAPLLQEASQRLATPRVMFGQIGAGPEQGCCLGPQRNPPPPRRVRALAQGVGSGHGPE